MGDEGHICATHSGLEARLSAVEKLADKADRRWDWIQLTLVANLIALVFVLIKG